VKFDEYIISNSNSNCYAPKIEKIIIKKNSKEYIIPIDYLAYIDEKGNIRNIRGEKYTKKILNFNTKRNEVKSLNLESLGILIVDKLINCENIELKLSKLVFLIDNELYDIDFRKIFIKISLNESEQNKIENETEIETIENNESEQNEIENNEEIIKITETKFEG